MKAKAVWTLKAATPWEACKDLPPGKIPWAQEVEQRLARKAAREAEFGPDSREGKCSAMTSGKYGPKRPCDRWALNGANVCVVHGANKQLRAKAEAAILEELMPSIKRLRDLRDQEEDLKVALGATANFLNRNLGEPGGKGKGETTQVFAVIVGGGIGGIPRDRQLTTAEDETLDGEVVDTDEGGEDPSDTPA